MCNACLYNQATVRENKNFDCSPKWPFTNFCHAKFELAVCTPAICCVATMQNDLTASDASLCYHSDCIIVLP